MVGNLAFFKSGPSKTVPHRPGPVQCVRNCTNCIIQPVLDDDLENEDIVSVASYDNLIHRQSIWISSYQTIQYHIGQVSLLKRSLKALKPSLVIYVVASTEQSDMEYLLRLQSAECLPIAVNVEQKLSSTHEGHIIIPIRMSSCPVKSEINQRQLLSVRQLRDMMDPLIEQLKKIPDRPSDNQVILVPVAINKDHEESCKPGVGSLCIQIYEPYNIREYISNLKTVHKTGHLIEHIYYDLAVNGACTASHMVAFLLLYLDRPMGVSRNDLIEYMDWLRKSAMDLHLHTAFTGESDKAVQFALLVLADYIYHDKVKETIVAVDLDSLAVYANPMIPNIAYYGIISRAIIMLNNRDEKNPFRTSFCPGDVVKIMKDDLLELSQDMAEMIDTKLPFRPPCRDVQTCVVDAFTRLQTCGHYYRIQEARIRQSAGRAYAGDYDSDEEYFISRRNDPAFKPWVILTQRPYRLDRLNLFMNAIDPILSTAERVTEESRNGSCDNA